MAAGTALWRLDLPIVDKLYAGLDSSLSRDGLRIEIINILRIADPRLGIAMALKAECHAERLVMGDHFHFVDLAVTLDAANPSVYVGSVVEVGVIRRLVNPNPRHRITAGIAFTNRSQQRTVGLDLVVAIHAGLRSRDV